MARRGYPYPADAVIDNAADGYTAEQLAAEVFGGLPVDRAQRIIDFANCPKSEALP